MNVRMLGAGLALGAAGAMLLTACGIGDGPTESFTDGQPVQQQVSSVRFDVPAGTVRIRVQENAPVSVRRDVRYQGNRPGDTVRTEGGTLVLTGCDNQCSIDYDVVLPSGVPISGVASAGNVDATGMAAADVTAHAGTVWLRELAGPATVQANAGTIEVGLRVPAPVTATAQAGSVSVTVPPGAYRVRTEADAGNVSVQVPHDPAAPNLLDLRSQAGNVSARTV